MADINTYESAKVLGEIAAAFGHALHARGIPVSPERSARFAECLNLTSPATTHQVYWVGRVTLVSAQTQIPIYDDAFDVYFNGEMSLSDLLSDVEIESSSATPSITEDSPDSQNEDTSGTQKSPSASAAANAKGESDDGNSIRAKASADEYLLERDFAACSDESAGITAALVSIFAPLFDVRTAPGVSHSILFVAAPRPHHAELFLSLTYLDPWSPTRASTCISCVARFARLAPSASCSPLGSPDLRGFLLMTAWTPPTPG